MTTLEAIKKAKAKLEEAEAAFGATVAHLPVVKGFVMYTDPAHFSPAMARAKSMGLNGVAFAHPPFCECTMCKLKDARR